MLTKEVFSKTMKVVEECINTFNIRHMTQLNRTTVKYIIKGGASIMAQIIKSGKDIDLITYDIDIAPMFLPRIGTEFTDGEYETRAKQYNRELYEMIKIKISNKTKLDDHGGLQTMQIFHKKWMDIVDFSFPDPSDEGSTFIQAINVHYEHGLTEFIVSFFKNPTIFCPPALEICIVTFGLKRIKGNLERIVEREKRISLMKNTVDQINLQNQDSDIPEEIKKQNLEQIGHYGKMIKQAQRFVTEEYKEVIKDKARRYIIKYTLLKQLLTNVNVKCRHDLQIPFEL